MACHSTRTSLGSSMQAAREPDSENQDPNERTGACLQRSLQLSSVQGWRLSFAGCYCSSMLAEFGAEVLRIEPPQGDFLRTCTPYGMLHKGEGLAYLTEGRNKFHITLNLKEPEGRELLKGLLSQADVLIRARQAAQRPGRPVADGAGAAPRHRQLLAVVVGLSGTTHSNKPSSADVLLP